MATLRIEIQLTDTSTGVSTGEILGRLADYLKLAIREKKIPPAISTLRLPATGDCLNSLTTRKTSGYSSAGDSGSGTPPFTTRPYV
jgi:hypothetical protein